MGCWDWGWGWDRHGGLCLQEYGIVERSEAFPSPDFGDRISFLCHCLCSVASYIKFYHHALRSFEFKSMDCYLERSAVNSLWQQVVLSLH